MAQAFEMDMEPDTGSDVVEETAQADPVAILRAIMAEQNIAAKLNDEKLGQIGQKVVEEYRIDKASRSAWEKRTEDAMKLAMLVAEEKSYPFDNAANIKYPLLTVAALQFNARAYPAIVNGKKVVKCDTWGSDPEGRKAARAKRVSEYMSYQLLSELPEWEEDTDKLLVIVPITGCVFRKVYYDPALKRQRTRLVMADNLVVNYSARSIHEVPRITEELSLYPYEIEERIRSGRFVDFKYDTLESGSDDNDGDDADDTSVGSDDDSPHMFLEQHRLLDLDEDGYPEPYIVTVHKSSSKTVRIVANFDEDTVTLNGNGIVAIRKRDYYVKYGFLPSPDCGFYDMGFGWLLKDIGESINTTLNQMLDAGHLSNVQGGLVSASLGIREKKIRLQPGEWKTINSTMPLNQAVLPITYPGPSATLFQLLGLLIEAGREVANIKDVLTGQQNSTAPATTTLALIEQGMQVFNSIYKRIHRSFKRELEMHSEINAQHVDAEEYSQFFDDVDQNGQPVMLDPAKDFDLKDMDVMPVSDPQVASRAQELARAQFLREWAQGNPLANQPEVQKRVLEAAQVEDVDKLISIPQPDPLEQVMKELLLKNAVLDAHSKEADLDKRDAEIMQVLTSALLNVAKAEGEEAGQQLNMYASFLEAYRAKRMLDQKEREIDQRGIQGVEGQPGNPMGAGANPGQGGQGGAGSPSIPVQPNGMQPGGMGGIAGTGGA